MADVILAEEDIARFWSKTKRNPETGCLEWTAATFGPGGYGAFQTGGRARRAHRVAWVIAHGPIPTGRWILHHCDNPPCVEVGPGHLFLGDAKANAEDRERKRRGVHGRERSSCCKWGHKFSGENLRTDSRGRRLCVTCVRTYHEKWMAAHPGRQHEYDQRRK